MNMKKNGANLVVDERMRNLIFTVLLDRSARERRGTVGRYVY